MKAYKFYGLIDRGKYRNTFQTDLSFPREVAMVTNPTFNAPKYKGRFRARGSAEARAITQLQCETKGQKNLIEGSKINEA